MDMVVFRYERILLKVEMVDWMMIMKMPLNMASNAKKNAAIQASEEEISVLVGFDLMGLAFCRCFLGIGRELRGLFF